MPLNVTGAFIHTALEALQKNTHKLSAAQKEKLCDALVDLCFKYAPGTFKNNEEKTKKS